MQGMHEFVGSDGNTHVRAARHGLLPEREEPRARRLREAITHPAFDGVILFLIIYSSALMAITDYGHFYKEGESGGDVGEPKADGSREHALRTPRARARAAAAAAPPPPPRAAALRPRGAARRTRRARLRPPPRAGARARARALVRPPPRPRANRPLTRARNRRPSRSLRAAPRALARS